MVSPARNSIGRVAHPHLLPLRAGEMHFDTVSLAVVKGVVLEGLEIEIAAKLPIDAREQIEIEFRGNALGVVIGAIENVGRLDRDRRRR